ncbi:roadblock/LC7 domain-containing protein [Nocardia sp. NBC_01503]|uniref:roadblock/LC7 domain-containing protein n=1 Tax=Nocardia sp. NBC_01503 TaxID=2975997 RepID=UPI002E7C0F4E|nr:roadblock/LC7 domain-containing protein [Nocardia sp. NBC_01503]WTL29076.1 roadblock/LC7 domain-containing protein [Nocardia sp. NBC_01503]
MTEQYAKFNWILDDLAGRLKGVRYVVMLSNDGLMLGHCADISRDDGERFSAMASALHSLGASAGRQFAVGGLQQVMVELDEAMLFVTTAGPNASLAVLGEANADWGSVAHEMNLTVQRMGTWLSTKPRHSNQAQ